MSDTEIHVGDIGIRFPLTIRSPNGKIIDISTASAKYIDFQRPDNTAFRRDAEFYSDGSDGIVQYITVAGDINQTGLWKAQVYIEVPDGKFHSKKTTFTVSSNVYMT